MYRILDDSHDNVVGISVDGKLTKEDYDVLIPFFENRITESRRISLLCDMTQFTGMEVVAFWEDFKFSIQHLRDFNRIAIVGDQRWLDWSTTIMNPLVKTEFRYFPLVQIDKAWEWVKSERI